MIGWLPRAAKERFVCTEWVNSLWPSDAIWQHISASTLAQVMTWCLMVISHYLNQCWLLINELLWHHMRAISQWVPKMLFCIMSYSFTFEINALPGANELNMWPQIHYWETLPLSTWGLFPCKKLFCQFRIYIKLVRTMLSIYWGSVYLYIEMGPWLYDGQDIWYVRIYFTNVLGLP